MKETAERFSSGVSGDTRVMMLFEANRKSMAVSYLLWVFVGVFGGHRFYNGRTASAVTQLLMWVIGGTLVSAFGLGLLLLIPLGFWLLLDAFLIPGWVTAHNTALAQELGAPPDAS
jgi:TM2 domain-containing membrane protein YozV